MKILVMLLGAGMLLTACGGNGNEQQKSPETAVKDESAKTGESANPSYDPNRGEGKFTNVTIDPKLNTELAAGGEKVYNVKCSSCHKTTGEKLVGPGWKGVTSRHTPEWILNFVTNTDQMIDKDPKAQAMLELCLVRMPNQNLTDDEARSLYEFMRKNDGVK